MLARLVQQQLRQKKDSDDINGKVAVSSYNTATPSPVQNYYYGQQLVPQQMPSLRPQQQQQNYMPGYINQGAGKSLINSDKLISNTQSDSFDYSTQKNQNQNGDNPNVYQNPNPAYLGVQNYGNQGIVLSNPAMTNQQQPIQMMSNMPSMTPNYNPQSQQYQQNSYPSQQIPNYYYQQSGPNNVPMQYQNQMSTNGANNNNT
jgi:hypothetical protein